MNEEINAQSVQPGNNKATIFLVVGVVVIALLAFGGFYFIRNSSQQGADSRTASDAMEDAGVVEGTDGVYADVTAPGEIPAPASNRLLSPKPTSSDNPAPKQIVAAKPATVVATTVTTAPITTSTTLKSYTDQNGALSFKYPSALFAVDVGESIVLATSPTDPKSRVLMMSIVSYPGYFKDIVSRVPNSTITTSNRNGNKVISVKYNDGYGTVREISIVSLDGKDEPDLLVTFSLIPNTAGYSQDLVNQVIDSLVVDTAKAKQLGDAIFALMKKKGEDASIKATLASMRPSAELYFDLGNGYINLCNPSGTEQGPTLMISAFKYLKDKVGSDMSCNAKKEAYAISAKLATEGYFCVDSTGAAITTKALSTGYSCQ